MRQVKAHIREIEEPRNPPGREGRAPAARNARELEFRQAVQEGLDQLDRGEGIPIEEVKAKIAAWAGR